MMRTGRYPFTEAQWQELEHQTLIFRYMASGIPVPFDLILPIRRSLMLHSATTSALALLPLKPTIGWGCFHMGFGRKAEDPEPGRCRRTDGKKWRCSKEAYPDSKYCERHMHRGKSRSRKPVEMFPTPTTTQATFSSHPCSPYPPPLSIHFPPSPSFKSPGLGLSPSYNTTSSHSSTEKDYRQYHGMEEVVDENDVFSEISEAGRGSCWQFRPLEMSLVDELKQSSVTQQIACSKEEEKHKHCFVLGADFMLGKPVKAEREEEEQEPRLLHCFLEKGPMKTKGSSDLEDHLNPASYTKTQLSISIPMAPHDFLVTGSPYRNGN